MPACCWYCKLIKGCSSRCLNDPLYCVEFCAWMDNDCDDFVFDEKEYNRLKSAFVGG